MVKDEKFTKCRAVIDEDLMVKNGDKNFFAFIGENAIYSLARSIYPADVQRIEDAIKELEREKINIITIRMVRNDGQYRWMLVTLKKEKYHLISMELQDVSEFEDTIDNLIDDNDTITEYFSLMEYLMISYDIETDELKIFMLGSHEQINFYNGTLAEWRESKLKNGDIDEKCIPIFKDMCDDFKNGTMSFKRELKMRFFDHKDKKQWCLVKGKTVNDMQHKQVIATMSVVNPVNNTLNKGIPYVQEIKDAGTDLLNKRAITNYARKLIESQPDYPVTIAVIDIDDFKLVNDGYGHMFGDEVISNVASIVKNAVEGKGISGRIGGDEMFIIMENLNTVSSIRSVLRTIRSNVEWMYANDDDKPDITCSIGSATYPNDAKDYDSLFNLADKMLYLAKEKGRNRYIIYEEDVHGNYVKGTDKAKDTVESYYKYRKNLVVNDIIDSYCINRTESTKNVAEKIALTFGLSSIYMYDINGGRYRKYVFYGNDISFEHDGEYMYHDSYFANFREDNLMVIDNANFYERKAPMLYKSLVDNGISQSIHIDVKQDICRHRIITFNRKLHRRQWGEDDIIYLSTLGNILGKRYRYDEKNSTDN